MIEKYYVIEDKNILKLICKWNIEEDMVRLYSDIHDFFKDWHIRKIELTTDYYEDNDNIFVEIEVRENRELPRCDRVSLALVYERLFYFYFLKAYTGKVREHVVPSITFSNVISIKGDEKND